MNVTIKPGQTELEALKEYFKRKDRIDKIYRKAIFNKLKFYIEELDKAQNHTERLIWGNKLDGYVSALCETDSIPFKWWKIVNEISNYHRYNHTRRNQK